MADQQRSFGRGIPVDWMTPPPGPTGPAEQQPLAGLACAPITDGTKVSWTRCPQPAVLTLAAAFDKRGPCRLLWRGGDGAWEHLLDAGYCSLGQRFHLPLPPYVGSATVTALDPDATLWVLADEARLPTSLPAVWPEDRSADLRVRFFERLETDCVAEFGWMGGCVLEAFDALARGGDRVRWNVARDRWLANFLDDEHLRYQDPRGRPMLDAFNTIEATLPIASVVRARPEHPIVDCAIAYLRTQERRDATCEGCYTVAYTLLQIAKERGLDDLQDMALSALETRRAKLFHEGDVYLRHHGTHRTYRNWARGVGWYLLGHGECLRLAGLRGPWATVAEHVAERVEWVLRFQRNDGLWSNFFAEPELPADTAGSAGIATALVLAHELGLADDAARTAAQRCWDGLLPHLLPDGWLGGTSPSNKRGEEAQHGPARTSETFGMGLMGRLAAALF